MSDPKDSVPQEVAQEDTNEVTPGRGRGRPELPPEQRRSEKVTLSFTPDEYGDILLAAAKKKMRPNEYARQAVLDLVGLEKKFPEE